jgi:hypothetical protein
MAQSLIKHCDFTSDLTTTVKKTTLEIEHRIVVRVCSSLYLRTSMDILTLSPHI